MRSAICESSAQRTAFCLSCRRSDHKWNWAHEQRNSIHSSAHKSTSITHIRTPRVNKKTRSKITRRDMPSAETCMSHLSFPKNIYIRTMEEVGGEIRVRSAWSHHDLLSESSARHSPLLSTGNNISELRWKIEKSVENGEGWWRHQREVTLNFIRDGGRDRHEKGVLIGVVSVCRLLKRLWNTLSLRMFFLKMCFSLFSPFPSGYFSLPFLWQQPYVRVQTQGEWTALPLGSELKPSTNPTNAKQRISRRKDDWHFIFFMHIMT